MKDKGIRSHWNRFFRQKCLLLLSFFWISWEQKHFWAAKMIPTAAWRIVSILVLVMFILLPKSYASVAGDVNQANKLYNHGQYDDAIVLYQKALEKSPRSAVIKYDLATALYKKGEYAKALEYFQEATQDKNILVKKKAEYNLGNAFYKSGIQKENTNVDVAIRNLQEALGHYGQTLDFDPKDADAQFNEDFVQKEIKRLKQKKQQQQQQQNQGQQKNQNEQQKKQQNQQSQGGQQKQKKQETQTNGQQKNQHQEQQNQPSQQKSGQQSASSMSQAQLSQKELDRKQAENLLEDYQQNEEPHKLLNYMPKKIDDRPVLKDW